MAVVVVGIGELGLAGLILPRPGSFFLMGLSLAELGDDDDDE